jgi:tetratricopeptide (TPR) repeat protein
MCHEGYPNLILKTRITIIENFQPLGSDPEQQSVSHPNEDKIRTLVENGGIWFRDFERYGNLESLEQAIIQMQGAADMASEKDPSLPLIFGNLAMCLSRRFDRLGNLTDINEAVARFQDAVSLDPKKPILLTNFGTCLRTRFEWSGNITDIDDAISKQQEASDTIPNDDPDKPFCLNNLGLSLLARFEWLGNVADLDNCIEQQRVAVSLTSDSHPEKPGRLSSLGISLRARFERLDNIEDINDAVTSLGEAVDLTPSNHPEKPIHLNNLGNSFMTRFQRFGKVADIDNGIARQQAALDLTPDGHPNKPTSLSNLGGYLLIRFNLFGNLEDMDRGVSRNQEAVDLTPESHPRWSLHSIHLANSYWTRFSRLNDSRDAELAISHLSIVAMSSTAPPTARFQAAERWTITASSINHHSILVAYGCAVDLMPRVAWLGLPIPDRHQRLIEMGGITRDAAAAAISYEKYDKALEWLEQGRSVVWTQILQLRTPVDELREIDPELADRLVQASQLLDQASSKTNLFDTSARSMEEEGRRYRALTIEWESIIDQVRSISSFENFLRPLGCSKLMGAARNGPVVVVNVVKERCDALALLHGIEEVIHIPLPDTTLPRVMELRDELKNFLYASGIRTRGQRAAQRITDDSEAKDLSRVLAELWYGVVKPVMDSLAFSVRVP